MCWGTEPTIARFDRWRLAGRTQQHRAVEKRSRTPEDWRGHLGIGYARPGGALSSTAERTWPLHVQALQTVLEDVPSRDIE